MVDPRYLSRYSEIWHLPENARSHVLLPDFHFSDSVAQLSCPELFLKIEKKISKIRLFPSQK